MEPQEAPEGMNPEGVTAEGMDPEGVTSEGALAVWEGFMLPETDPVGPPVTPDGVIPEVVKPEGAPDVCEESEFPGTWVGHSQLASLVPDVVKLEGAPDVCEGSEFPGTWVGPSQLASLVPVTLTSMGPVVPGAPVWEGMVETDMLDPGDDPDAPG